MYLTFDIISTCPSMNNHYSQSCSHWQLQFRKCIFVTKAAHTKRKFLSNTFLHSRSLFPLDTSSNKALKQAKQNILLFIKKLKLKNYYCTDIWGKKCRLTSTLHSTSKNRYILHSFEYSALKPWYRMLLQCCKPGPNFITESSDTPFQDISLSITFNTGILKK